jgi:protein-disulfide isomerase
MSEEKKVDENVGSSESSAEKVEDGQRNMGGESAPVESSSTALSSESITISKDTLWKYSTFVLGALLIVGAFAFFIGDGDNGTGQVINNPPPAANNPPSAPAIVEVNYEDAPSKGNKDAPVVLVEYTDYQCPFCERHFTQTYSQIVSQYVDTGKVLYVSKDFPLNNIHPQAQKAAEATHCVRDQLGDDGFFKMHDLLFQNQASLNVANFKKWAREVGADGSEFDGCLDSGKNAGIVAKNLQEGQADGIRGTPGFLINGKALSGAQPFSAFQQAIESEL